MTRRLSYVTARRANRVLVDPQGSDDVPVFWPALDLYTIDGLDHVTAEYDADVLKLAASMIEAGKPLEQEMAFAVAGALRELAEPSRHPDITPQPVRALNLAVHFLAAKEIEEKTKGKSASALKYVALAWRMPEATVQDLIATRRADAPAVLETIIADRIAHGFTSRAAVIDALDSDMQLRAGSETITRPAPHKTRQKKTSRKI
jgi:hypothetical protein